MEEGKDIKSCSTSSTAGACTSTATLSSATSSVTPISVSTNDTGEASVGADSCPPQEENGKVLEEGESAGVIEQFLINPEVTELILGHLDMERLKTCRLVCRTWTFEISSMLKARAKVRLINLKDFEEFKATCEAGTELRLPLPFKRIRLICMRLGALSAVVKGLQRYSLTISEIVTTGGSLSMKFVERESRNRRRAVRAQKAILLALEKCGGSLECLGLRASLYMIPAQNPRFPNLKELWLLEMYESVETIPQRVDNLREIFNSAPNLTHLQAVGHTLPKRIVESWKGLEKLSWFWLVYDGPPEDILIPMSSYEKHWALQSFQLYATQTSNTLTDTSVSQLLFQVLAKVSPSIRTLAFYHLGKLVGSFPECPCLTRLYLSPHIDLSDPLLSFANLVALKALAQLTDIFTEGKEEVPAGVTQPYKNLQRLSSLDIASSSYVNNEVARSWFKRYSLAFPMLSVWAVYPVHLPELSALALRNEVRVQTLTVRYGDCVPIREYLGAIKLIPGLEVLQLHNIVEEDVEMLHLNSIELDKLRDLKILHFYYSTYEDVLPALKDLKRLESVFIFGAIRTHSQKLQDILLELPNAIGLTSCMLDSNGWNKTWSLCA